MRRLLMCLVAGVAVLAMAAPGLAVTKVLKQGVDSYTGCSDTYIDVDSPTANFGGLWYMHMYMRSDDPERSLLLRFNLTGQIPSGSIIQSATLSVWLYQLVDFSSSDWVQAGPYRVRETRNWVETQATWNQFNSSYYWATPGCESTSSDRYGTPDSYLYFYNTTPVNAYYHWDVTASVQAWMAGAANQGWLLRAIAHDGGNDGLSFNAKESAEAYRPYLTVVYDPPVPADEETWGVIKALFK